MRDWRCHANCKSPRSYGVGEVLGGWWTLDENANENSIRDFQHSPPRSLVVTVLIAFSSVIGVASTHRLISVTAPHGVVDLGTRILALPSRLTFRPLTIYVPSHWPHLCSASQS
jgi:hypothetical protein